MAERAVSGTGLRGMRVLIVEDEFLIAQDLASTIEDLGGEVVGPVPSLAEALEKIADDPPDVAVLDINLSGEMVFPAAEDLRRRAIPFVFTTGYSDTYKPLDVFPGVPCLRKPYDARELGRILGLLRHPGPRIPPTPNRA
jgi:CheY-like chemotaxis protein